MDSNAQVLSSESGNSTTESPNGAIFSSPSPSNFECSENINDDYNHTKKNQNMHMSQPQLLSPYNNYKNYDNNNYNDCYVYNNYNNYNVGINDGINDGINVGINGINGINGGINGGIDGGINDGIDAMINPLNAEDYILTQQLEQLRERNAFLEQHIEKEEKSFKKVDQHLTKKILSSQQRYNKNLKEYVENINKENKTQKKITKAEVDQKIQQIAQIERNFQQKKNLSSVSSLQNELYRYMETNTLLTQKIDSIVMEIANIQKLMNKST